MWPCQVLLVGVHGAAVAPQVWMEKFASLPFVQKMVTVSELVKNCSILSMLCSVVLWINSPGSMKICSVKRNRFFMKIKGSMLRVTKETYDFSLVINLFKCCVTKADFASRT